MSEMSFDERFEMGERMDKKVDKLITQIRYVIPQTCVAVLGYDEDEDNWRENKGFHIYIEETDTRTHIYELEYLVENIKKVCYENDIKDTYLEHHSFTRFSLRCYFEDDKVDKEAEILDIVNALFVDPEEKLERIREIIAKSE